MYTMQQAQTPYQRKGFLQLFTTLLQQNLVNSITEIDPWGTLIATGAKGNETRNWPARLSYGGPAYRGPLAIHISKRLDNAICFVEPFCQALQTAGYAPSEHHPRGNAWGLPLGHIVAVAWLDRVWQINQHTIRDIPDRKSAEYAFGNYQPGRFVWTFSCVYRLACPIPARGAQGIWKWTPNNTFWDEIQTQLDKIRSQPNKETRGAH